MTKSDIKKNLLAAIYFELSLGSRIYENALSLIEESGHKLTERDFSTLKKCTDDLANEFARRAEKTLDDWDERNEAYLKDKHVS